MQQTYVKEENMPSWITHLVTANQIKQDNEKNEFIFANIMPDILEGFYVKDVSKMIKDYQTHYPKKTKINGINIPLPDIERFKLQYQEKMKNPIIKGYYCHLLTDYYWNTYSYQKYFKSFDKEKNLVKIQLNNGKEKIVEWDEAVKIKQRDFRKFTKYLSENREIIAPVYTEKIKGYVEELKEFSFTKTDIESTIIFIQEMLQTKKLKETGEYQIFTQKELLENLDKSIEFIKTKLE